MLDDTPTMGAGALGRADRQDGRPALRARLSTLSRRWREPSLKERAARRPPQRVSIASQCALQALAERAAVMVDGADYFAALADALAQAKRRIVIVGWDFDAGIVLTPQRPGSQPLGQMLRGLVEAKPELEIHILVWSLAVVHAPGAPLPLLVGDDWQAHPRIRLKLDTHHPIYASHHQKIVSIDEDLAFVGGIDLTVGRWDTSDHAAVNPLRVNPDGSVYGPIHDLHMAVLGPAARKIASYVRDRWEHGARQRLEPLDLPPDASLWPGSLEPHFATVPVALARTEPRWRGRRGWQEGLCLARDALAQARRVVYIESQYFSAAFLRPVLEDLLKREDGPEVVLVLTEESHSMIEHVFMGRNRDRLLTRLARADRHGRLRAYHPVTAGDGDKPCPILVHSKLVIVDDRILRIGSSNLNNRSTGLDTELDVAVEAQDDDAAAAIRAVRDRLVAEHVGAEPGTISAEVEATGSLIAALERCNGQAPRRLLPISIDRDGPTRPVFGTGLVDPRRPVRLLWPVMALVARLIGRPGRRRV